MAMAAEQGLDSHPLLARPSAIAGVAPALPARVFLPTQVQVLLIAREVDCRSVCTAAQS